MRAYIEDWEIFSMKRNDQITSTHFLAKYEGLSFYDIDMEKIYSIDNKGVNFVKEDVYDLISIPDYPDGTSTYHEYFCIHDDLFNRIIETGHNYDITLKVIHKEPSFSSINVNISDSRSDNNSMSELVTPRRQLQIKRQKKVHDYSQK